MLFDELKLADNSFLKIDPFKKRYICPKCQKAKMHFCQSCIETLDALKEKIPKVSLPLMVDIFRHKKEIFRKSTSVDAKLIAPDKVELIKYDLENCQIKEPEIGEYLLFPKNNLINISIDKMDNPIKKIILLDAHGMKQKVC